MDDIIATIDSDITTQAIPNLHPIVLHTDHDNEDYISPIDKLLENDKCTLEDLLDHEDLISELQCHNKNLIK